MTSNPTTPKRFGQTAGAKVDVNHPRQSLSTYAGQELLVLRFHMSSSEYGPYAVLTIKRHGEPAEEVTTSGETIMDQLHEQGPDDWPFVAWLHQAESKNGRTGRIWFSDESPDDTLAFKNKLVADIGRLGKRGD